MTAPRRVLVPRRAFAVLVLWWGIALGSRALAEPVPFEHFRGLEVESLERVQVQLTYLGGAKRRLPSLSFTVGGSIPDTTSMRSARWPRFRYGAHESGLIACRVSMEELRAMIDSVATLPDVTAGDVDSIAVYSFELVDTTASPVAGFGAIVNENSLRELIPRLYLALKDNPRASTALARIGCAVGGAMGPSGDDVTSGTTLRLGLVSHDAATRRMTCVVRITNNGPDTLSAPLALLIEPSPAQVTLLEPDGFTCGVMSPGCPYVLLAGEGALAPGTTLERRLVFANPRQETVRFGHRVYAATRP